MRYLLVFIFLLYNLTTSIAQKQLLAEKKYTGGPNVVQTFLFETKPFSNYSVYYTGYTVVDTILFYIGSETFKYSDEPKTFHVEKWSLIDTHKGGLTNYKTLKNNFKLAPSSGNSYFNFLDTFPYITSGGLEFEFTSTACTITIVVKGNKQSSTSWNFKIFEEIKEMPRDTLIVIDSTPNPELSFNYQECNKYGCFVRCTTFIDGSSYLPNSIKRGDIFYPMSEIYQSCEILIFDRWGNLIRKLEDRWEVDIPPGVYVYLVRFKRGSGFSVKKPKKGSITVF